MAAVHADVTTVNAGYRRTTSSVLVRRIERPTRSALDWAAYHANFMNADPAPEGEEAGGKADDWFMPGGHYSNSGNSIAARAILRAVGQPNSASRTGPG